MELRKAQVDEPPVVDYDYDDAADVVAVGDAADDDDGRIDLYDCWCQGPELLL